MCTSEEGSILDLFHIQCRIGWSELLKGRIAYQWREIQDAYFKWLGRRNTGRTWVIALITKLWNVTWDMWDNRNDVKHNAITAADQRRIEHLDGQIREQFQLGRTNLSRRDFHWINRNIHCLLYTSDAADE